MAEEMEMAEAEQAGEEQEMAAPEALEATEAKETTTARKRRRVVEEQASAEAGEPAERVPELAEVEQAGEEQEMAAPEALEATEAKEATAARKRRRVVEEQTPAEATEPAERVPELAELDRLGPRPDLYYYGTGRRKTSSAQVRLYPSKEPTIIVNDKPAKEYFSRQRDMMLVMRPLRATATEEMFRVSVRVQGGGVTGQAGAVRHGIARALTRANPELRRTLRKEGSLTRDPRMKERKKPGLKRARKAPQYTKR